MANQKCLYSKVGLNLHMPWPWNKCKHLISFDGMTISFSGLEGLEVVSFKETAFQIKKDLFHAACDIAQLYDVYAYSNCQKIQELPKDSPVRGQLILEAHKNEERLLELLTILKMIAARPSEKTEKALADWIAFTFAKRVKEEAPIIPKRIKGGRLIREQPPAEEYSTLKRSITKAKTTSHYLQSALTKPSFDINKLYALGGPTIPPAPPPPPPPMSGE